MGQANTVTRYANLALSTANWRKIVTLALLK